MTKIEQLNAVAQALNDEQVDALISFAQALRDEPFYDRAPPEALASIERGLAQIARGEMAPLEELARRLDSAAQSADT